MKGNPLYVDMIFKLDFVNRKESSRRSLRCCSPIPSWRSDKEAIYISGASWTRPSAPYS
ncbi:unnamed protein product, partial [Brugia timori]|uniref:Uncharacterized protein n=1 Tax=Brugia timori TaxID=42155 RepID=A0A0R3RDJ1_9BILA